MADFEDNNPFAGSDRSDISDEFSNAHIQEDPNSQSIYNNDLNTSPYGSRTFSPDPAAEGLATTDNEAHNSDRTSTASPPPMPVHTRAYSSRVEQILMETPDLKIQIIDAGKCHEGNSRGFIAYTIRILDLTVRRRYSEFESLRTTLTKLFPTLIIPPIPEKHTMSDYAASPTKAKEDSNIIDHRQRMLTAFLNRCRDMKQVNESAVFQRFLDPNSSWSEVLSAPPVCNLPKNILKAPPLNPSEPTPAHAFLPIPSASAILKAVDDTAFFDEAESNAKEYEAVIAGGLEKVNKRIVKRYSDMAADYSDLGARLNAFSLEEDSALANAIEKVGQAIDNCYISTEALVSSLSSSFSEPLGESAQFAVVVRSVLKYRRQKALQLELTSDQLAGKRQSLETLERSELEAQRINSYLSRDLGDNLSRSRLSDAEVQNHDDSSTDPSSAFPPTHAAEEAVKTHKKSSSGFKLPGFGKLNNAIHGIIDVDPESTRRSNISRTREQIGELEAALKVAKSDVEEASESVRADLERFQHAKEEDLRTIMRAYIQCHVEWARNNLESWKEAKVEIDHM